MGIPSIITIVVLATVSGLHLFGTFKCNKRIRKWTKALILPLIILFYCLNAPALNLYVIAAFVFCWLGDILLLGKGFVFLVMGGVSFALAHVCFVSAYVGNIDFTVIPYATLIPIIGILLAIINMSKNSLKEYIPKSLRIPMMGYLFANAVMNAFAIMQMFSKPNRATITISLGALIFLYSDTVLFDVRFHKSEKTYKRHTIEMLAYIIGEILICYGFTIM